MRLLLVEDDQRTADFIISGLKQAGYQIDHVSDGHKAYFQASEEVYDVAVMDVMLPGMDGLTIIQKLRARGISLPIIVLSARKEVDERVCRTDDQKGHQSGLRRGAQGGACAGSDRPPGPRALRTHSLCSGGALQARVASPLTAALRC